MLVYFTGGTFQHWLQGSASSSLSLSLSCAWSPPVNPHLFPLRENFLFDTKKMSRSFFGPEIFFVPYLTLTWTFIPNMTPQSNPSANGVKWLLKRPFCPWVLAYACSGRWAHACSACRGADACMQRIWPLAALFFSTCFWPRGKKVFLTAT